MLENQKLMIKYQTTDENGNKEIDFLDAWSCITNRNEIDTIKLLKSLVSTWRQQNLDVKELDDGSKYELKLPDGKEFIFWTEYTKYEDLPQDVLAFLIHLIKGRY